MFKTGPEPASFDEIVDKLQANSLEGATTGCFLWQGYAIGGIYGGISWQGKLVYIHRLVFEQVNGYLPEVVRHSCDTPRCWNPDHLLDGSHADNVQDKVDRDRHLYGEKIHNAKLNEHLVREIRASSLSPPELATKYGVSRGAIHCVLNNQTWKHIR